MNEPKIKKEKVGPDGLTKKERRALKVADKTIKPPENNAEPPKIVEKPKEVNEVPPSKKDRRAGKVNDKAKGNNELNKDNRKSSLKVAEVQVTVNDQNNVSQNAALNTEEKTKALLRAERRQLQEKQRLAKLGKDDSKLVAEKGTKKPDRQAGSPKPAVRRDQTTSGQVQLFNHLHFRPITGRGRNVVNDDVHPSFITLGAQYASKTVLGSNARCLALLAALKDLVEDFVTPTNQELCRSLETFLQTSATHLQKCRPFAVSMTNALRHFKVHLTQVSTEQTDAEKKRDLLNFIDIYVRDEIHTAGKAISLKVSEKICNGDVILTYGCSSLIKKILTDARCEGKSFKVIIVDSRPLFEGREMLRKLTSADINCCYTLVNAISYVMGRATKVLLGAHALLANGSVMARIGTAQVALVARAYNKPVLVCCETYKFCERVQTDSFVYNELGDSEMIVPKESCEFSRTAKSSQSLIALNLMYDVTPPDLVTAVVTELGFLPCTSVPVVLRIKPTE